MRSSAVHTQPVRMLTDLRAETGQEAEVSISRELSLIQIPYDGFLEPAQCCGTSVEVLHTLESRGQDASHARGSTGAAEVRHGRIRFR